MARVYLSFDDLGLGIQFVDALEAEGDAVAWPRTAADAPPDDLEMPPDVVILGASDSDVRLGGWCDAWRALDPPPGVVVLCADEAHAAIARSLQALPLSPRAEAQELRATVARAIELRFTGQLNVRFASHATGLPDGGDELARAEGIVARARAVDEGLVREALRPRVHHYATATPLAAQLAERQALDAAGRQLAASLDGAITLGRAIDNAPSDAASAARLLWALACVGGLRLTTEPPDQSTTERRAVTRARQHLRERRRRLRRGKASYYEVLEVPFDPSPTDVESAVHRLAVRFAPNALAHLDLGELAALVEPLWRQIDQARRMLGDPAARAKYHEWLTSKGVDLERLERDHAADPARAEEEFLAGQAALTRGEVFKAQSFFAAAARRYPDHADYDAYLAWARYRIALEKDEDTADAALRERALIEAAQTGRGPRPRALFALGMLCAAADDPASARWYLEEALACDPQFAPARQILERMR